MELGHGDLHVVDVVVYQIGSNIWLAKLERRDVRHRLLVRGAVIDPEDRVGAATLSTIALSPRALSVAVPEGLLDDDAAPRVRLRLARLRQAGRLELLADSRANDPGDRQVEGRVALGAAAVLEFLSVFARFSKAEASSKVPWTKRMPSGRLVQTSSS